MLFHSTNVCTVYPMCKHPLSMLVQQAGFLSSTTVSIACLQAFPPSFESRDHVEGEVSISASQLTSIVIDPRVLLQIRRRLVQ
jgi:hypothetical protein